MELSSISQTLGTKLEAFSFPEPVTHVYNPTHYAKKSHDLYLQKFAGAPKEVIFLGMNPGPFGMAQTGVPFGEIGLVRDWMGIEAPVGVPEDEHPKRPITGFECTRSEVSGRRLWGWARDRFGSAETFFERFFVWNYCPLAFMTESGANFTPDKFPVALKEGIFAHCDEALRQLVDELNPAWVIGVGKFAEARARNALGGYDIQIGTILHPSPASPAANRGWSEAIEKQLCALGIEF